MEEKLVIDLVNSSTKKKKVRWKKSKSLFVEDFVSILHHGDAFRVKSTEEYKKMTNKTRDMLNSLYSRLTFS